MENNNCAKLFSILLSVTLIYSWQFFTKYADLLQELTASLKNANHSEYIFGDCNNKDLIYYTSAYVQHPEIKDKIIVRGWLDIFRLPTCIRLRAYSHPDDIFSNAFHFQICVLRITYIYSQNRTKYFYYEWFLPEDMVSGLNWMIYFFGPSDLTVWGEPYRG